MVPQVETYTRSWRADLEELARSTEKRLFVASPYIKRVEAEWLCSRLPAGADITAMTDLRLQSVVDGSLDIDGLALFDSVSRASTVVTLPGLHAKVFIADSERAIVTSANLTTPGLDRNYEYGVGIHSRSHVRSIRRDLENYAQVGNVVDPDTLDDLAVIASEVTAEERRVTRAAPTAVRRAFSARLRAARRRFAAVQVGARSSNAVFGEAIRYILTAGPRTTRDLAPDVQRLLPDLCDDRVELVINGERYGKEWKHRMRNAQQHLKRRGEVEYDRRTRAWRLVS